MSFSFWNVTFEASHRFLCCLLILVLCGNVYSQTRSPVPSAEQQKETAKLLADTYNLNRLETAAKKLDAAKQLVDATRDSSLSAGERYVVLVTVVHLTKEIGNFALWSEAVEALTEAFDVDANKERAKLLADFLGAAKSLQALKPAIEDATKVARGAAEENRYADAITMLTACDSAIRRVNGTSGLKPFVADAREAIAAREKLWKAFQAARTKLDQASDDAAAALVVGRWHVFQEANWEVALPFLLKGSDGKWKAAAELERSAPTDSAAQAALGDAWWEIAQSESAANKTALLIHAGEWYERAQPQLASVLKRQQISKRLDEISTLKAESLPKPTSTTQVPPRSPTVQSKDWIDLLDWTAGVDWKPLGIEWDKYIEGKPTSEAIVLRQAEYARFPLAAVIDGNYELEIEFTRQSGTESVGVVFPIGTHILSLELNALNGKSAGVGFIDGKWFDSNPTARSPSKITNGERHHIRIQASTNGTEAEFKIDLDNVRDYITWKGRDDSLISGDFGPWAVSMIRHIWLTSHTGRVTITSARIRMLSGTAHRDTITDADRELDLKNGLVRLVGEKGTGIRAHTDRFSINQIEWGSLTERRWPRIIRDFHTCEDYYGAHAPSHLKCSIPPGAKSFSGVAYNCASGSSTYKVLIDGKQVDAAKPTNIAIVKVDIPPKSSTLELIADPDGEKLFDTVYWCYPRFHPLPAERLTDKMLDGKPGPLKFDVTSSTVGEGVLTRNTPLSNTTVLNFRDAQPCDEFIFAHAFSSVTFTVPSGMTRFSAIGYNGYNHQVKYEVWADGKRIYDSPQAGIIPINIKLPLATKSIELKIDDFGGTNYDHAMWCYPRLYRK